MKLYANLIVWTLLIGAMPAQAAQEHAFSIAAGLNFDSATSNSGSLEARKTVFSGGLNYVFHWFRTGIYVSQKHIVSEDDLSADEFAFTMLQIPLTYRHSFSDAFSLFGGLSVGFVTGSRCDRDPKPGVTIVNSDCGSSVFPTVTGGADFFIAPQFGIEAGVNWISANGDTFTGVFAHLLIRPW